MALSHHCSPCRVVQNVHFWHNCWLIIASYLVNIPCYFMLFTLTKLSVTTPYHQCSAQGFGINLKLIQLNVEFTVSVLSLHSKHFNIQSLLYWECSWIVLKMFKHTRGVSGKYSNLLQDLYLEVRQSPHALFFKMKAFKCFKCNTVYIHCLFYASFY